MIFAYHGYPWLIHRLTYRRHGHDNLHVRGYKEEGTTTTPFDMVMLNDLDRFHLVMDVIDRVPGLASSAGHVRQLMADKRIDVPRVHPRARRGRPRDQRLEVAVLTAILVVNAGSSSMKLRVLSDADQVRASVDLPAPRGAADAAALKDAIASLGDASTRSGTGSCTAATCSAGRS